MDRFHLGYSVKNIPKQGKMEYLKDLTANIEIFSKSMGWKALFCLKEIPKPKHKETYGFKSPHFPWLPTHPEGKYLAAFEKALFELVAKIR